ncbi:hypothetical protein HKX48_004235 [Thoreauomyces humboldtii]|nr:hypothetical protein HKX48_004235 [Thoreauomyces humboldtii]
MATPTEISKLRVPELKEALTKAGLPVTGKKEDLVARLLDHRAKHPEPASATLPATTPAVPPAVAVKEAASANSAVAASSPTKQQSPAIPAPTKPVTGKAAEAGLSEEERRKARAARFGIPFTAASTVIDTSVAGKKANGAKAAAPKSATPTGDKPAAVAKTASAAKAPAANVKLTVNIDAETLKKRAERFGAVVPDIEKIIKRTEEEERKRKRAERFGEPASPASPVKQQKTKV